MGSEALSSVIASLWLVVRKVTTMVPVVSGASTPAWFDRSTYSLPSRSTGVSWSRTGPLPAAAAKERPPSWVPRAAAPAAKSMDRLRTEGASGQEWPACPDGRPANREATQASCSRCWYSAPPSCPLNA